MKSSTAILKALKKTPNFRSFPDDGLLKLIEVGRVLEFSKKDYIYQETFENGVETADCESFFIIVKGCIDLSINEDGREVYLCTLGEGEIIGETGIFPRMGRVDNAVSTEDSKILEIKKENFIKFMKENRSASNQILLIMISCLIKKLQRTNRDLAFERREDFSQSMIDELIQKTTE